MDLARLIFTSRTPLAKETRDIENHYHLARIAKSTQQALDFQALSLCLQAKHASELDRLNWTGHQDVARSLDGLGSKLDNLASLSVDIRHSIQEMSSVLHEDLVSLADLILQQQESIERVFVRLGKPYETSAREIRAEADKWLQRGMTREGSDRTDNWNDALRLFKCCTENPIGSQDYFVHFQIGWLKWKLIGSEGEAEASFDRARRLSQDEDVEWNRRCLRHLAYMRYLRADFDGAYDSAYQSLVLERDPLTLFDAARYAARLGRTSTALSLLEEAVRVMPSLMVKMLDEEDFLE